MRESTTLLGRRRSLSVERRQRRRGQKVPLAPRPQPPGGDGSVGAVPDLPVIDHLRTSGYYSPCFGFSVEECDRLLFPASRTDVATGPTGHGSRDIYVFSADSDLDTDPISHAAPDPGLSDDGVRGVPEGGDDLYVAYHRSAIANALSGVSDDSRIRVHLDGVGLSDAGRDKWGREKGLTCC